jgi:hypothetical protein
MKAIVGSKDHSIWSLGDLNESDGSGLNALSRPEGGSAGSCLAHELASMLLSTTPVILSTYERLRVTRPFRYDGAHLNAGHHGDWEA